MGFITVILVAIPFSVYIAQKRQQTITKATKSTTLSLEPASTTVKVGDTLTLGVMLDPGANANLVSFIKLKIIYDSSKFATISGDLNSLGPNSDLTDKLSTIEGPAYELGKASISLSIGADPAKVIATKTKIAILKLQATNATTPTAANITFDSGYSQVLSIDNGSQTGDNVLFTTIPATITVTDSSTTTTTTVNAPSCTSLNVDRATTGTVPYAITFAAAGNSSSGTISKVSFNFGDGSVQDLITGAGIGTNSVSNAQTSHTYNTAGTYTAYAILTGNNSALSTQQNNCSQTITVKPVGSTSTGGTITTNQNTQFNNTPIATSTPQLIIATATPQATLPPTALPPTGPGEKILNVGILGAIFTIIGGALFVL